MWQKFSERARRVVFYAQEEAGQLGENYVSTEHLLLGLVREQDSMAARVLERMGVSLGRIRSEVERTVSRGGGRGDKEMELTPRAKQVIEFADDEAKQFGHSDIGTEHLLLGLIREGEGLGGRVLHKLGVDLERTRREVLRVRQGEMGELPSPEKSRPVLYATARAGDLGIVRGEDDRLHVEITRDAPSFVALDAIFAARDTHGYHAMQNDQTLFLLPSGTPVKMLLPPLGENTQNALHAGGFWVRVLDGTHSGTAGWMRAETWERTGSDDAPFPPPPDVRADTFSSGEI